MQHSGKCPQIRENVFHIREEQHLGLVFLRFKEAQDYMEETENNCHKWKLTTVHPQENMGQIFQDYS